MLSIKKSQENRKKFSCSICDYITCNKYDYEKHINTVKHKNNVLSIESCDFSHNLSQKSPCKIFTCQNCNKKYKDSSGLWRHKQKCNFDDNKEIIQNEDINYEGENTIINDNDPTEKELIMMLIKQNSELLEVIKNGTHNTNNSYNNNNSNNKSFNLNFFLNETCKDAMNIMDFVESIKLQLSDLESVGKLGFVEGISNIITTKLKAMDVTQRPVHCADNKREVLYIKDENKWEKEDEQKNKIRKAIKRVATKNMCLIPKFKEAHPDCNRASSKYSDQYNKIIVEACGGSGDNDAEKEDKIIRNIAKQVTIDKKQI